jgi:23S rRNA (cytidine2498-2'-O)-methyltransferase
MQRDDEPQMTAYLAADGFVDDLVTELGEVAGVHGNLVLTAGPPRPAAWAQNVWHRPERIAIASVGDAARKLRDRGRNWAGYSFHLHRRLALIEAKLPHVSARPLVFGAAPPAAPMGGFTLLDAATLLAAPETASPFRHGEIHFVEDRDAPPSRAYLKLWEAFTRLGVRPGPGDRCLDLGASPGGWTWVLAELGATVVSVDKAPLDPRVASRPEVEVRRESAFGLAPAAVGPVDWLLSDVICYPARLLGLIRRWLDSGLARRFVCTVKFQGATDHDTARALAAIPGARLVHLFHNRHELTFIHGVE